MTIAVFDLTEHTQMSIRGTTGTHPDSKYVFGIYISSQENYAEELLGKHVMPDITAYDDMDWSKAVELAKWILNAGFENRFDIIEHRITDNCVAASVWDPVAEDFELYLHITVGHGNLSGGMRDICDWERAERLAQWILEWDDRLKEAEEC